MTGVHRQVPTDLLERICLRCVGELGVGHAAVPIATIYGLRPPAFASTEPAAGLALRVFTPWRGSVVRHGA